MVTRRWLACVLNLIVIVVLSACASNAPPLPAINYSEAYDFSVVTSVAFEPRKSSMAGTVELSEEQAARFRRGLEDALKDKGITLAADTADAQLVLRWQLMTQEKVNVRSYDFFGYLRCWRCGPSKSDVSMQEYTQRTFVVDMIEPGRGQSVWRGVMQARIEPDQEESEVARLIDTACAEILAEFPPKPDPSPFSGLLSR